MKALRVAIIGNSVAVRTRPYDDINRDLNYGIILESILKNSSGPKDAVVFNYGGHRVTIVEGLQQVEKACKENPEFVVLNFGIVVACSREIPLWFSNIMVRSKIKIIRKVLEFIYDYTFKRNRPWFTKLRNYKPWTSPTIFENSLDQIVASINSKCICHVLILTINKPSTRIENQLPGSIVRVEKYNEIICKLAEKHGLKLISSMDFNQEIDYPDGVHYSKTGNTKIANQIASVILSSTAE